jgi:hypothetical protein
LLSYLVDLIGIEPMTSSMPWKRAPSCATGPHAASDATSLLSPLGRIPSNFGSECRERAVEDARSAARNGWTSAGSCGNAQKQGCLRPENEE